MSKTIDERVVEMRFDNKQFESNVATSMSTLEKLKRSLKFDGASKGLEGINAAANKVTMSGLSGAIDTVKAKFSAMDVVAITALANITNRAMAAGESLVKSLSIDQVTAGWQKYSDKTVSVATLVAQGNAIEDVNAQLSRLNWFTDETSYNFTDMVSNIAKFTATGKGLEESVTAMEGIANWAALSGQNASTASRAMYQLAQAMGAGVMRLEDYKSIQNASMDTEEFRQKCIEAAISLGTLKDNSDGTYTAIASGASAAAKKTKWTISQFASNLTDGMWLTSDVMMQVFNEYSSAVNAIYEVTEEKEMLASEVISEIRETATKLNDGTLSDTEAVNAAIKELGYTAENGELLFDAFGIKAFEAAQQARTFRDAIDSVKDAVSTGWMNTFELIFGDATQATKLWTDVANQMWDIFAGGGETRNDILETTMVSGWDKLIERITKAGIETGEYEQAVRACAEAGGINVGNMIKEYGSLSEAFKNGAIDTKYLKDALAGLSDSASETVTSFSDLAEKVKGNRFLYAWRNSGNEAVEEDIKRIQEALNSLGYDLSADGKFGKATYQAVMAFQKASGIRIDGIVGEETIAALEKACGTIEKVGDVSAASSVEIDDLLGDITKAGGQELIFDTISNSLTAISTLVGTVREAWGEIFTEERVSAGLYKVLSGMQSATETLVNFLDENSDKLKSSLKGVIAIFDILTSIVGGALKAAFEILNEIFGGTSESVLDVTGSVGDVIAAFRDWLFENNLITKSFNKLVEAAKKVIDIVRKWVKAFADIPVIRKALDGIKTAFDAFCDSADDMDGAMSGATKWIKDLKKSRSVQATLEKLKDAFGWLGDAVEENIEALGQWFEVFKQTEGVQEFVEAIQGIGDAIYKIFTGDIDSNEFARSLGTGLAKILLSLPKMAIQAGEDFVAGFINGLGDGIGGLIEDVVEFCTNFISAFNEALGIDSPSWISFQSAVDWCQGFINGLAEMLAPVLKAMEPIVEGVKMIFSSFWKYITDENGEIEWGKIIATGITIESLIILKTFADAMDKFASAATSLSGIISAAQGVLKAFSTAITGVGKAVKNDLNANALMKLAISIGILVASIWVLTTIPSEKIGLIWNAVAVIVVLAAVLAGLTWAMGRLSDSAITFNKEGKKFSFNAKGAIQGLIQVGIVLLLIAATVKLISTIPAEDAKRGFATLGGIAVGLIVFMAAMGGISKFSGDVGGFGTTLLKIAVAMGAMVYVIKMIAKMDPADIVVGIAVLQAFAVLCLEMGIANYLAGEFDNGSSFLKMAVTLGIMAIVLKIVGGMKPENAIVGVAVMQALVILLAEMALVNRIAGKEVNNFSKNIMSMAFSMLLLAGVMKILGNMTIDEVKHGFVVMEAFVVLIAELILVSRLAGKESANIALNLIGMAMAIGILAAIVVLIGYTEGVDLTRGVAVVAALGLIMSAMIWATRGASDCRQNLIVMASAIVAMTACVVALSLIDDERALARAVATLGSLMLCFTLMTKAAGAANVSTRTIIALGVMTVVVAAFAGLIFALSHWVNPETAVPNALALSALLIAFSAAMKILATDGSVSKSVSKNLKWMVIIAAALGAVLIAMSSWTTNPSALIPSAVAMGILLNTFSTAMRILATGGRLSKSVSENLKWMAGVAVVLGAVLTAMSSWTTNPSALIPSAIAMGILLNAFSTAMRILATGGRLSESVSENLKWMAGVAVVLGVMLTAMSSWTTNPSALIPSAVAMGILLNAFSAAVRILATGGSVSKSVVSIILPMAKIAVALGVMLTAMSSWTTNPSALIPSAVAMGILLNAFSAAVRILATGGSVSKSVVSSLGPMMLVAAGLGLILGLLSAAMSKWSDPASTIASAVALSTLLIAFSVACAIVSVIPAAAATQGALGLAAFIGVMAIVIAAAGLLLAGAKGLLTNGADVLGLIGTAIGKFIGGIVGGIAAGAASALPAIGEALTGFMEGAQTFIYLAGKVDASVVAGAGYLAAAILVLSGANFISGIASILSFGTGSFASLGAQLLIFGIGAKAFFDVIKGVDATAIEAASNVAGMILALTVSDFISAITESFGGSVDFSGMGEKLKTFGEAVVGFSDTLKEGKVDTGAIQAATDAGKMFVALNESLSKSGGLVQKFFGEQDLEKFATAVKSFAECMLEINAAVSGEDFKIEEDKISQLTAAGTQFSELYNSLPKSGGDLQKLLGEEDLKGFGESAKAFAGCMLEVNEALSDKDLKIQEDKISQLTAAGTQFSELYNSLPKSGGDLQKLLGEEDLKGFGESAKAFAVAMIEVSNALSGEGVSINVQGFDDLKTAGTKLKEMQDTLPKTGGWWEDVVGSSDIGDFGDSISKFATAILDFSNSSTGIDTAAVDLALGIAEKIKELITSLVGLDTSGVDTFTGIGTGGFGADGPAYDIAKAMVAFSNEVTGIDTQAVTTASTAAMKLKTLIAGLVGLDTSGVENFKPDEIGVKMKDYGNEVSGIDTGLISSSISCANRLKNFISSLADLESTGVSSFNIGPIGTSLKTYSNKVSGFNYSKVNSSISAANSLKSFIDSLSGLDTSGVGSFSSAVSALGTVNVSGFIEAFSSSAGQMSGIGTIMANAIATGVNSGSSAAVNAVATMVRKMVTKIRSQASNFRSAGVALMTNLKNGISSQSSSVSTTAGNVASAAVTKVRGYNQDMYQAGEWLMVGLASGILINGQLAIDAAEQVAGQVTAKLNVGLGNASPSKIAKQSGAWFDEGLAIGLEDNANMPISAAKAMANTVAMTVQDAISRAGDLISSGVDAQPTIRPVVDLSDVRTGAAAISGMFNSTQSVGVRSNLNAIGVAMNSKLQNGTNNDIISAINKLSDGLENSRGDTYNFGDFTYDDGSAVADAVGTLVRYARIGRRV